MLTVSFVTLTDSAISSIVQPDAGRELSDEMEDLASPVGKFVRERCVVGPEHAIARAVLYDAYLQWCRDEGKSYPDDVGTFGRNLRAAVASVRSTNNRTDDGRVRSYTGIAIRPY